MNMLKNKIDFIFLIEHPKRELEFIKKVASDLTFFGYSVKIISIHYHLIDIFFYEGSVILMPYCLDQSDFPFSVIPKKNNFKFINFNWEQLIGPITKSSKVIKRDARNVIQLYWSDDFKSFLKSESKIKEKNLVKSVNPGSYILSNPVINNNFLEYLKKLNFKKYYFLPVNYNWAMMSEKRIKSRLKLGYSKSDAETYVNYSKKHQLMFFDFVEELLKDGNVVVLRPHPGITTDDYKKKLFSTNKFILKHPNFYLDDNFNAYDWINHAEYTVSNWSTLIHDAHFAGKKAALFWPEDIPTLIDSTANKSPHKIKNLKQLQSISKTNTTKAVNYNYNSFIKNLITIKNKKINQNLYSKITKLDFLKIMRTLIYSLSFKSGFKFLIKKRILKDHFYKITYTKK